MSGDYKRWGDSSYDFKEELDKERYYESKYSDDKTSIPSSKETKDTDKLYKSDK